MICAALVVKNEESVLPRCFYSLQNKVDKILVIDTGSTDHSISVSKSFGAIVEERTWINFGHNYTELLNLARPLGNYILHLHADMEVISLHGELDRPSYNADIVGHGYKLPLLLRSDIEWRYEGVTHEYLTSDLIPYPSAAPVALKILHHCDGSRRSIKFQEDLELLKEQLRDDPHNSRTVFYLANTYRDLGQIEKSAELYGRRIAMGGWQAEIDLSLEQLSRFSRGDTTSVGIPSP